jgi:sucrose-6-phosphate hydrolase SacC (GH32 family)
MEWSKQQRIFDVDHHRSASLVSHAAMPYAFHLHDDRYRVFFSSRNADGKSLPYYFDCIVANQTITPIDTVSRPLLALGGLGTFDDSGIMPSSVLRIDNKIYLYYVGWSVPRNVSYHLAVGLAISHDDGQTFQKYSTGPILDRDMFDPHFSTTPYVTYTDGLFRMWYTSCTGWIIVHNHTEPQYLIKYCESLDGIHWRKGYPVSVGYSEHMEAIARPSVIYMNDTHHMYFSYRKLADYRTHTNQGYKIGHVTSLDGIHWDSPPDLHVLPLTPNSWDSDMVAYCHVFIHQGTTYMLYNGNGFGKSGIGYAVLA